MQNKEEKQIKTKKKRKKTINVWVCLIIDDPSFDKYVQIQVLYKF